MVDYYLVFVRIDGIDDGVVVELDCVGVMVLKLIDATEANTKGMNKSDEIIL